MAVFVNLYSVMMNSQRRDVRDFDITPRSRCSRFSIDVPAAPHHLTTLNDECGNLISKCNIFKQYSILSLEMDDCDDVTRTSDGSDGSELRPPENKGTACILVAQSFITLACFFVNLFILI